MQRLGIKKSNEIHQKNFPRQYFVVVYEKPNCGVFFFLFSENTVSEQKTKSNGNLLILVLKSILCHNAQIGDKSIDI